MVLSWESYNYKDKHGRGEELLEKWERGKTSIFKRMKKGKKIERGIKTCHETICAHKALAMFKAYFPLRNSLFPPLMHSNQTLHGTYK